MARLEDIRSSLIRLLHDNFDPAGIKVFGEDIDQLRGRELDPAAQAVFPCLHLQLTPLTSTLVMGADSRNKVVLADITYMEETKTTNKAMYDMADQLEDVLGNGFWVQKEHLCVENLSTTMADDLLHVTFQMEFNRPLSDKGEDYPLFETISLSIERKNYE